MTQDVFIPKDIPVISFLGPTDQNLRELERQLPDVKIHVRGRTIALSGSMLALEFARGVLDELFELMRKGITLDPVHIQRSVAMMDTSAAHKPSEILTETIVSNRGKAIRPNTLGQQEYVQAIADHTVTFGIGPAGTGKTYLAMAKAVQALQTKRVNRIVLTRPAVEAGERLGFLPGTLNEKIDPYLRPLYDALHEMMDPDIIPSLMETGTIEVAPLAYMRGRTLNESFIILDEAQNTSPEQMKMFLTRLGFGSKIVVTGDVTQIDLPRGVRSGLRVVESILTGVDDIKFCRLTSKDVVRHRLVSEIINAYDRWDADNLARDERAGRDEHQSRNERQERGSHQPQGQDTKDRR